ncbi:MATE family efflux transporter [Methanocaldococcus indicus]|uniref:MATE family efflux transporter n=1 Tax=Methanocaldococcus indicus TaxID=213231 RepID=UPI003C6D0DF7
MELLDNPKKSIIRISKPIIFATFFESLYSFADSFWVAGLGAEALASVGASFPILIIFYAFAWGLSIAVSSLISRSLGENNIKKAEKAVYNAIILAIIYSLFVIFIFYPNVDFILNLMNVNLLDAVLYSKTLILGTIVLNLADVFYGVFRGVGRTKIVMIATIVGCLINIILDPIFIYTLKLGVLGAGIASVVSIFISLLILIFYYIKTKPLKIYKKIDFEIIKDLLRVSIPSSFNDVIVAGTFFFLTYLIMMFGNDKDLAVFTGALRITEFGFVPLIGLSSGAVSVIGALYGAKLYKKVREAYLYTIIYGLILEFIIFSLIVIFSDYLAYIFSYGDISLKEPLSKTLKIVSIYLLFIPFTFSTSSLFQALGRGEGSFLISIIREFFHISSSYILALFLGYLGICIGWSLGDFFAGIISLFIGIYVLNSLNPKTSKVP